MDEQDIQNQQLFIIDGQLIGSIFYIASLVISVIMILNQRQRSVGKNGFLTPEESQALALLNKILLLLLVLWFLYLNHKSKNLAENTNQDTSALELQIKASIISIIPALIGLYVVITNFTNTNLQTAEIENPFI